MPYSHGTFNGPPAPLRRQGLAVGFAVLAWAPVAFSTPNGVYFSDSATTPSRAAATAGTQGATRPLPALTGERPRRFPPLPQERQPPLALPDLHASDRNTTTALRSGAMPSLSLPHSGATTASASAPTTAPLRAFGTMPAPPQPRALRIGYHARTNETALTPAFFESLARFLAADADAGSALAAAGFARGAVEALRAEDHADLVRRMDREEFDLVFCSAMAFVEQKAPYTAFLQTASPRDRGRAGPGYFVRGAVIASARSELFAHGKPTDAAMRKFIASSRMAVVSSYSAAGYLYPLLGLRRQWGVEPADYLFCDSSEEVAKFVINGLADLGALDEKAIEDVTAQIPGAEQMPPFIVTVTSTAPLPPDPVVIRTELAPSRSRLGQALAQAIKRGLREFGALVIIVDAPENAYDHVKEAYAEFRQEAAPAPLATAAGAGRSAPDPSIPSVPAIPEAKP